MGEEFKDEKEGVKKGLGVSEQFNKKTCQTTSDRFSFYLSGKTRLFVVNRIHVRNKVNNFV